MFDDEDEEVREAAVEAIEALVSNDECRRKMMDFGYMVDLQSMLFDDYSDVRKVAQRALEAFSQKKSS
ncbi:hypothetical protein SERLA73DRAFT_130782 [Serpula lacrymans var. lacrymans S7.3]|uniref:Nucleotide exchange factor Fes1 domain-containing protein n=1 Tax=Serpula lacrymans var. lacrymans (strain S7.3) TaxID=936435 RepID=F8PJH8_SERL3|nr:hypothetical protein SERLA73DRAFT_130782 [Serpula lacrymans var. lacrymans S7.3]